MRSEQEMLALILGLAREDPHVRGVILNGSRANPQGTLDQLRDYDVVWLVDNVAPYKEGDISSLFGSPLVVSRTDESALFQEHFPHMACTLMLFTDGNRIDLTVARQEDFHGYCFDDRLSLVLLDKDGVLPDLPFPSGETHWTQVPSIEFFEECRTEFWWTAPYITKALLRGQLVYAQSHLELCTRKMLLQMMAWHARGLHGEGVSAGKCGDGLEAWLPPSVWKAFLNLFPPCEKTAIEKALFDACALFTEECRAVAALFQFSLNERLDQEVPRFLREVYPAIAALPPAESWDKALLAQGARIPTEKNV